MTIDSAIAQTIVDPKAYADLPRLDAAFATLRRSAPFEQAHLEGYDPFWVAARHKDVLDIELRSDVFQNGAGSIMLVDRQMLAANFEATGGPNTSRSLVEVDGQEHRDLRAVTFASFSQGAVRLREEAVRNIARGFVADLLERAPACDFVKEVAYVYPLRVVMTALGIPQADEPFMLRIAHELHGAMDADVNRGGEQVDGADAWAGVYQAITELDAYYKGVTTQLRANPSPCINSLIANAKIGGEYLTEAQLMGYYLITATAGHDTTAHTIATAMWVLAERPELLAHLQSEPAAVPKFVDESIRWATPVKHFMRTAVADAEVNGQKVKQGDWIMLAYHSANRDEAVFDAPFEFRIDRPRNAHVSFGYGRHVCLGQHLARLEMRILWEELLPRLKDLALDGAPRILQSNFVCGPKYVPIRYTVG